MRRLRRGSRKSNARAEAPTAKVVQLASGRLPRTWKSFWKLLPSPLLTPKSLLSCPMAMKTARPVTKPSMTGLDRNCVMKPRRKMPAMKKPTPTSNTSMMAYDW